MTEPTLSVWHCSTDIKDAAYIGDNPMMGICGEI